MKIFSLLILSLLLAGWSGVAQSREIGAAAIVKNSVTGKLGGTLRSLRRGSDVFHRELISTSRRSMTRLKFLDNTRFTIGANSSVRLSSFVYDPARRRGKIAFNALKGAFRFISGKAKSSDYRIKTPLASTGVRGTVIDGYIDSRRRFDLLILRKGAMVVCGAGKCVNASRPGTYVLVKMNGNVATGKWAGSLKALIKKHMYKIFPGANKASTNAVLREFDNSFRYIR